MIGTAGCLNDENTDVPEETIIPKLWIENHQLDPVTCSLLLTDQAGEIHLWETMEVEARTQETGGSVGWYEFDQQWLEPRDYQIYAKLEEQDVEEQFRLLGGTFQEDCFEAGVSIDDDRISLLVSACSEEYRKDLFVT